MVSAGWPGDRGGMVDRTARADLVATAAIGLIAGALGLAAWTVTMASAPRHSFGPDLDMGDTRYFPVVLGAAGIGGWLSPRRVPLVGLALGAPGLLLAPWTAPRGDGDGLWILILPILLGFVGLLCATAFAGGWIRTAGRSALAARRPAQPGGGQP
jgi:hypothetical protein